MKKKQNEIGIRIRKGIRTAMVGMMLISAVTQAAYKSPDISDITGEQKIELAKLWAELRRMPPASRDCYICEQLGLMFSKDYSQVLRSSDGYPGTTNTEKAYFVGSREKVINWMDAVKAAREKWGKCYEATKKFKAEAPFVPFRKDIQKIVCNTAKYLLGKMPKERRCLMLALISKTVYNAQGTFDYEKVDNWGMENGIDVKVPKEEGRGYIFMDPEGKEHDIRALLETGNKDWRWRQIIWRCENLVGAKDILSLFPDEVKAIREHFKERVEDKQESSKAALEQVDTLLQDMPQQERERLIAEAAGAVYDDGDTRWSGYDGERLCVIDNAAIYLSDGTRVKGPGNQPNAPAVRALMNELQYSDILEHFREPIKKMVAHITRDRLRNMPSLLRDALRAELSGTLTTSDGSPATDGTVNCDFPYLGRPQRTVKIPHDKVLQKTAMFPNADGKKLPYSIVADLITQNQHSVELVYLCAYILGKEETVRLMQEE